VIALDSSALIAILMQEPERAAFAAAIAAQNCVISAPTLVECRCVAFGRVGEAGLMFLDGVISSYDVQVASFDQSHVAAALDARMRFGRGSGHAARLNLGDCFSYALAKTRNIPLLFKGADFIHTDIIPALAQAAR
jgi:ribonuclease VapC